MKVLIGADPEFFVKHRETGHFVPICGLLGGTKDAPIPIPGMNEKGFMQQEDGAAAEFNIPPQETSSGFVTAIMNARAYMARNLRHHGVEEDPESRWTTLTDAMTTKFPQLNIVGCDPDIYAYATSNGKIISGEKRLALDAKTLGGVRGVGGHVHIGYDKSVCPPDVLVKLLDLVLAVPMREHDEQGKRRRFYGLAGLYREKPYGLEYRTLSNFWIFDRTLAWRVSEICRNLVQSVASNVVEWQRLFKQHMASSISYVPHIVQNAREYLPHIAWLSTHKVYTDIMEIHKTKQASEEM